MCGGGGGHGCVHACVQMCVCSGEGGVRDLKRVVIPTEYSGQLQNQVEIFPTLCSISFLDAFYELPSRISLPPHDCFLGVLGGSNLQSLLEVLTDCLLCTQQALSI